jgi:hypothetical protein
LDGLFVGILKLKRVDALLFDHAGDDVFPEVMRRAFLSISDQMFA